MFGENGAGKSTLISIIAGAIRPDSGTFAYRRKPVDIYSVHHARSLGISAVFQEFSLVPQMTIEENLFLGGEMTRGGLLNRRKTRRRAREVLERLGFELNPADRVSLLSRAEQQMVEIAKAFRSRLSVLILDEPTASLTDRETERLFELIDQVRQQGVGIIYITHRMQEIRRIGDRITVLRDGIAVGTVDATVTEKELVRMMSGKIIDEIFPRIAQNPARVMLETKDLSSADGKLDSISIQVAAGEIVGLAGLVGSGKSELARACFGLSDVSRGKIRLDGNDVTGLNPSRMIQKGFFYLPADRRREGLLMTRSARESIALPGLREPAFSRGPFLRRRSEAVRVRELATLMNLQPLDVERMAEHFSGGNQQKILLAKSLARKVKVFAFDEPTVGVDVETRVSIYRFIGDLCEQGAAVLLVSSDLPEILNLPHRVYVMCGGRLSAELAKPEMNQENVLRHCFERDAA